LGFAIAEGPVFPSDFHEIDHQILRLQARGFSKNFGHALEEFAFLLGLASGAHRNLREDDVVEALDTKIGPTVDEAFGRVLGDRLKAVVGRESECFNHGALHAIAKRVAIVQGGSLAKIDSYDWHGEFSSFVSMPEKVGALPKSGSKRWRQEIVVADRLGRRSLEKAAA
jgi:hypothetical protein